MWCFSLNFILNIDRFVMWNIEVYFFVNYPFSSMLWIFPEDNTVSLVDHEPTGNSTQFSEPQW